MSIHALINFDGNDFRSETKGKTVLPKSAQSVTVLTGGRAMVVEGQNEALDAELD